MSALPSRGSRRWPYGRALDAAGSQQADFDIEGNELTDDASTDCSGVKQSPGAFGKAFAG